MVGISVQQDSRHAQNSRLQGTSYHNTKKMLELWNVHIHKTK